MNWNNTIYILTSYWSNQVHWKAPGIISFVSWKDKAMKSLADPSSIISTSLTVPAQPPPRFLVEAWLPFRNREMDYSELKYKSLSQYVSVCGSFKLLTTFPLKTVNWEVKLFHEITCPCFLLLRSLR